MFKYSALFLVLLLPATILCQSSGNASPAETLTLDQAVELALKQNRLVNVERIEVGKASDRLSAIATRRLPGFDISVLEMQWINPPEFRFKRGVFGVFPGLGPVPPVNTTITSSYGPSAFILARATQPLTQLHRIGIGMRISELGRDIAEGRLELKKREVTNQVRRSYYAILQLQSALNTSRENLKLYRELDRVVGDYVAQQISLTSDGMDVKTKLAKEEYESLRLGNNLAAAKEGLNHLMGRDIRTDFTLVAVSAGTIYEGELSSAQTRALSQRPEVREAQLKLKQAEYDHKLKKAEYLPEISVTAGYFSAVGVSVLPQNAAGVGFTLSWEPFDWGRRRHEAAEKLKTIEQAREGVRETESLILRDVSDSFRKLNEAKALLKVAQLDLEASREKLRVATSRYAQEVVLYKEVLTAQASLSESENRYQQALLAFWSARADFEKALGEI